jgi:Domain of unknown function (DUF5703)
MPLGNGDIGINAWVETNGDLCFYIGKTDTGSRVLPSVSRAKFSHGLKKHVRNFTPESLLFEQSMHAVI